MAKLQFAALCLFTHCLLPVSGYIRSATAVTGDVVKGAGNLTKGGKVGIYATLLQVLNPGLGDLTLLMECCGEASSLADKASYMVNTNQYTSPIEENIKKDFVGEGKCKAPGPLKTLLQKGQEECTYFYNFKEKDYKEYSFSAYCVPNDVISGMADTKGLPMGYTVVNQILNRNAGELVYTAEGYLGFCYDGMNRVNEANNSFNLFKPTYVEIFGQKFDTGYMENVGFPGLGRLNIMDMMKRSVPAPFLGTLFVYKNNFWSKSQSALNITHFDMKQWAAKKANLAPGGILSLPLAAQEPASPDTAEYQKDMGKELGKVSDDLAPFQNKDLTPEQQAGLTQLMSNKESAAFAKKIYAKVQADKKKAAETKAKLDGLIGMMGFTKRTADNQPEYGMPPAGKNQIKPISELNLGALMKKPSAPPPTGLDALPKAAAAALPKEAAAALESPTGPAAHPLLQKLVGGAKGPGAGAANPAAHPLLQKLMGGAKGPGAGAANPAAQKLTAGAGAKGPGAGYGDAEAATKDASVEVIPALGGGFKNPLKAKSGDEEAATKDETMTFNGFKVDVQSEEELKAQHAKLKEQLKGGYGGYGPDGEAANKDAETPAATGTAPTAPAPHPLLHMVKENGQALKDHPRLKHLLEAFKAKHATPKHNKAPDLQDLLKQADATSLPSRDHPRLKALVEEAEHMKETVV